MVDGVVQLMGDLELPVDCLAEVLHGTTVATNAILERQGARTALITTKGMRDLLELRRIRMPHLYDPLYERPEPLVPRELHLEVEERVGGKGEVVTPLKVDYITQAVRRIRKAGVEAVAVTEARPPLCITHYPGSMVVTDLLNARLAVLRARRPAKPAAVQRCSLPDRACCKTLR